jgi:aspartate aminotransferase
LHKITGRNRSCILPGESFGRPDEELTARIAYVDFDGNRAVSAAQHLNNKEQIDDDFNHTYCSDVVTATELICNSILN